MVTILVVEDDTALGRLYSTFLTKNGYSVIHTTSIQQTEQTLAQASPDIAILDINLPDGSGLKIAHLMRESPDMAATPIIVLSAIQPTPEELQQHRIEHVLRKPVSLPILQTLLKQIAAPSRSGEGEPSSPLIQ